MCVCVGKEREEGGGGVVKIRTWVAITTNKHQENKNPFCEMF